MANKLIIKGSVEAQIETAETVDSASYSIYSVDKNVGSNGGSFETTYADAKATKITGVALTNSGTPLVISTDAAFEGTPTKVGAAPSTVKAFFVRYDSTLGTVATVTASVGSTDHAILSVGEATVIPLASVAIAECKLEASAYGDDAHEASVTVILIGD